ncbi:BTAD domain-containing putative transcriptional regulator [Streptomyces sp. VRA16 Mangrove soil]|uniref:BTAD domain-containing putative transcriptional regulator n=1 Tax=Streptomyces sp. VRA16 Mangrove soil TaxID=2817434 RepID=UPI001A9F959A|nr:BTAD domain-containing putative transcriptional regulator [Streptomyces sp. VRA16 Mangrove soil]MBO1335900.1 tetratricopeptide repeat protein [Streptomyces sp. VRA16 Mangrove soil]
MRFGILGPLDVRAHDGSPLDPGGPRPRALLTLLLLDAGRTVSAERLIDGLYGENPPAGAANALQSQISRLRKRLDLEIEAGPAGYRLAVDPDGVDLHRFERLAREGRQALTDGDPARARALLREGLGLWRGPAPADLPRLDELRLGAAQDRIEADLALGGGADLIAEVRQLLALHPLSERLYGLLMRALHTAGRSAEALQVYEEARHTLADELGVDPSAELSALHLELLQGQEPRRQHGVPAQLTRFVGRADELTRIDGLLTEARLVTLTGPGGAGKTRLGVEAARSRSDVCYVELAPLTEGARIPYAILTALGAREGLRGSQGSDATERLVAALESRELLLVLDNCEHVINDAAKVAGLLLATCPGLRILATSREGLGITGEVLCPVPPLAAGPAAQLFRDRAAAVRPDFETHDHAPVAAIDGICAALDGLPLAIELAAARLRTLTVEELAERLGDRFRVLSRGDRTKAPRHRTLRAVVEWSWELLDDEERDLACRMTVFAGSGVSGAATLEAVERVCGIPYPEDLLASLTEKSFLEAADGRYRMLETIRAFCAEQLPDDVLTELRDRHAAYFLRLAEEAEPQLRSHGQLPWLARLSAEQGNLDAALRHLIEAAPRDGLRLMAALSWFWRLHGLAGERVPLARELLDAVGPTPPPGLEEEYALCGLNSVMSQAADEDEARLARADLVLATIDRQLRLPFTVVLWTLAVGPERSRDERVRAQVGDDPWGRALLSVGLGFQEQFAGRPAASEALFTEALAGFREAGDRWGMANSLDQLGMFADWRGERTRALELLDEALGHVRELAAPEETADLLCRRGTVLLRSRRYEEATADFTRACELARAAGAPEKMAGAYWGMGDAARLAGDRARAREHYETALETSARSWYSVGQTVHVFLGLGRTALAEGRTEEADDWFRQARILSTGDAPLGLELAVVAEALASRAEELEQAALLLGAASALRGRLIEDDPDVTPLEQRLRRMLAPEVFKKAFELGGTLREAAITGP